MIKAPVTRATESQCDYDTTVTQTNTTVGRRPRWTTPSYSDTSDHHSTTACSWLTVPAP